MSSPEVAREQIVSILRRSEIFLGLSDPQLSKIASLTSCAIRDYVAGTVFCREGDSAESLAILAEGRVNLMMKLPASDRDVDELVDTVTKGGVLTLSWLVAPYLYTRTAVCVTSCRMLLIDGGEMRLLLEEDPQLGYEVARGVVKLMTLRWWSIRQLLAGRKRK